MTVRAPAKVNLHLSVGPLRPDGYHELTTVFQALGLYDDVTLSRADALTVTVDGEDADLVPLDGANLAARAVSMLAVETGSDARVAIHITKGTPVAGGCAGGSADAAAALVAADALWGTDWTRERLAGLGALLGSDVPFGLHGGTALGTGRGERLAPVFGPGTYSWVLALAEHGLSTPAVYGELDRQRGTGSRGVGSDAVAVLAALREGDAAALGAALRNDLQPAALALRPELGPLLDAARGLDALGAVVSGSGPTVAVLARDPSHADRLAASLVADGHCGRVRRADGPVAGAHVVEAT